MNAKFVKQVTVDFLDHRYDAPDVYATSKTFYPNEVIEFDYVDESARGFLDLHYANGDVAVGVPSQSLTLL